MTFASGVRIPRAPHSEVCPMTVRLFPPQSATIIVREFPNASAALAYAVEQWRTLGRERFTVFLED